MAVEGSNGVELDRLAHGRPKQAIVLPGITLTQIRNQGAGLLRWQRSCVGKELFGSAVAVDMVLTLFLFGKEEALAGFCPDPNPLFSRKVQNLSSGLLERKALSRNRRTNIQPSVSRVESCHCPSQT